MLIDWFTVGAQIVNFLLLIYLLKRFLYKPILRAMDEREQKIAGRLQEAAEARKKAEAEARVLAEKHRELEDNRKKMQAEARAEIKQWRDEAMEKARQEVEKARNVWQENLEREKDDFIRKMKTTLSRQVFRAAAKALQDLADEKLETRLVDKFRHTLGEAVRKNEGNADMGDRLQVISGFVLSEQMQNEIKAAAAELFPDAEVVLDVVPEVGYGIMLTGNNRKVEWSLTRYMAEMEEKILSSMHLATWDADESA
ncbi:MAG: hypothetical protein RBR09_04285 [Desulfobulbaceae bacterium]|nr:hypothetical protein [Desulfobulbaceae bacterium]MDY0350451.1 hypothetical protein [Desulfobulbaceae bacterium]